MVQSIDDLLSGDADDDEQPQQDPLPRKLKDPKDAREQAAEYLGFTASKLVPIPNDSKPVEIPNPGLFNDEQQSAWDEMELLKEQCEKAPETVVPDTVMRDKDGNTTTIEGRSVPGGFLMPLRFKNDEGKVELFHYERRQAIAVLGEEEYKRFKAGGGQANDIALLMTQMRREFEERIKRDPKSAGSAVDVAPVSDGNRG